MTTSKLSKIEFPKNWGPFDLLKNWIDDYKSHTNEASVGFNLATASKLGQVKNRFIIMQELCQDGILFNTNPTSPKAIHIKENPNVAASFLFVNKTFCKQVRIEGEAQKLQMTQQQYECLPFVAQMRSALITEQSQEVDWDDLKFRHDGLVEEIDKGIIKFDSVPDNLVVFKIIPKMFDFYYSQTNEIADRVLFKSQEGDKWTCNHITA
ncbi:unnamed protein product [Ceutorhynchus assimilis]|uniref:pyridoxal 5'-phosphate synthase n=1 Tax=Ceutorhynchus assimilis TaxID=467358 RepID=A0A9N9Q8D2_9CUCU|nr:unnamed protein product [Ceutorhynchus assimilis]